MTLQFIAVLLFVQLISAAYIIDVDRLSPIDTLSYNGFKTPIFNFNGVLIAKPVVIMEQSCPTISYNYLLQSYQMSLSIKIDQNPLETAKETDFEQGKPGHFQMAKIQVDVANHEDEISTSLISKTSGNRKLVLRCDKSAKCNKVGIFINTKSNEFQNGLEFKIIGKVQNDIWIFKGIRIATLHKMHCSFAGWIAFHRRVDGSLSFAQNWDAYAKGFGDPKGNYWMGLEQLHSLTVRKSQPTYKCKMGMELVDWHGNTYRGLWNLFQVMGAEDNYRLKVGEEVKGTQIVFPLRHNDMQFSTYDRDNDNNTSSCSGTWGKAGWWFSDCYDVNVNGEYSTPKGDTGNNDALIRESNRLIKMKESRMKIKCS